MSCHVVACLRHAECSRAPDYITNGHGSPMQTAGCTWPQVVPVGEDPAAHGHWCAFTDLYHAMPCHAATGAPSWTSAMPCHTMPCSCIQFSACLCHAMPCHAPCHAPPHAHTHNPAHHRLNHKPYNDMPPCNATMLKHVGVPTLASFSSGAPVQLYHAMPCPHMGGWLCSGSTSLSADTCFRTCDLLAQTSVWGALCCTSTRQRCRQQTNLVTVHPRLARATLERWGILLLGSFRFQVGLRLS